MSASRWGPLKVEEIMHRDVRRTNPEMCVADAARKMRDLDVGCLPVVENEKLIGIITDRDIVCRAIAGDHDLTTTEIRDVMSEDVAFCFYDQVVGDAAQIMQQNKVRRLPVFDHDKHMVGILTLSDLCLNSPELSGRVVQSMTLSHS